jgi:hypothetical protein
LAIDQVKDQRGAAFQAFKRRQGSIGYCDLITKSTGYM